MTEVRQASGQSWKARVITETTGDLTLTLYNIIIQEALYNAGPRQQDQISEPL
jgi:hypothetical protein